MMPARTRSRHRPNTSQDVGQRDPPTEGQALTIRREFFPPRDKSIVSSGESTAEYEALLLELVQEFRPRTPSEWLLVRDLSDHDWEVKRYQSLKSVIIRASRRRTLRNALNDIPVRMSMAEEVSGIGLSEEDYCDMLFSDNPADQSVLERRLARGGLSISDIDSLAVLECLPALEQLDDLVGRLQARRSAAVRNLEKVRGVQQTREVGLDTVDAEFV